ncbi:MAG: O-methyltransferase [Clostridia bacterium]|nr:O-methyltransferase [Clostridia bacterium]
MFNEYTSSLTYKNLQFNIPKELLSLRNEYRETGVPTILEESLNELLLMVSIKQPKNILELGTATGCSGIAMLLNAKNAKLVTIEKFEDVRNKAINNFRKFGVYDRVNSVLGDSVETVMKIAEKFDFIFLDCNKASYVTLYPLLKDLLSDGGVLFVDNVLFRGYVSGEVESDKAHKTLVKKIDSFNQLISSDKDMITCFFDVGDGICVSVKKGKTNE